MSDETKTIHHGYPRLMPEGDQRRCVHGIEVREQCFECAWSLPDKPALTVVPSSPEAKP